MFTVNNRLGFNAGPNGSMLDVIKALRYETSLNLVVDAGDARSYPGTGQDWFDISGSGNHYFLGSSTGADGNDPAFFGGAGGSGAHFLGDDTSYFTEASAHTYADNWHKNNGVFTIVGVYSPRPGGKTFFTPIWNNRNSTIATAGVALVVNGYNPATLGFAHSITTTTIESVVSIAAAVNGAFNFFAVSYNESTPSVILQVNGTQETPTISASTDTDNITVANQIGLYGTTNDIENGDRIACVAAWSRALSAVELMNIYKHLKAYRFTNMP